MRLGPVGHHHRSTIATSTLCTLLAVLSLIPSTASATTAIAPRIAVASSALLLSRTPVSAQIAASQRHFRIGRPAAALYSTMSSSPSLPAQNERFSGFESTPPLEPSAQTAQLIRDAMDLFGAKPTPSIFARSWSPTAIFADPICHAEGSKQYLAQWYGMPAAFAHSETLEWKLTKQDEHAVEYVQKQRYKVKGLGVTKDMISTVVMERGGDGKIVRFEDRWNHKPLGGALSWPFRRLNAWTLPWLVGVPKETKSALQEGGRKDL